jgi:membrane-associated protease RseP (regulator of RpoE activity)
MLSRTIILAFCLIWVFPCGLRAQQTVPPPPKPADDGPSLEVTMKFIQDKLNDIGPLRYSVGRRAVDADRDSVFGETDEITNVVADPQRCTISYRLQESAKPVSEESSRDFDTGYDGEALGVTVRSLTQDQVDRQGLTSGKGVIVTEVRPDSFAEDIQLQPGDVIVQVNKQPVNGEEDFSELTSQLKSGQDVVFLVHRDRGPGGGNSLFVSGTTKVIAYSQRPAGSYEVQGRPQESARPRNATFVLDLKEVKKIEVRSVEQDLNEASGGKTSWTIRPPIFEVVVQTHLAGYRRQLSTAAGAPPPRAAPAPATPALAPAPRGAIIGGIFGGTSAPLSAQTRPPQAEPLPREGGVFSVDDEELAKRVARALLRAVELCTPDKKAEAF